MTIEDRGRVAGRRTVATFEASTNVAHDYDRLVDRRRWQRRNHTLALAAAVVVAVFAVLFVQSSLSADSTPQPMEPVPGIDIGDVPVWYDNAGLHRGDVVEQTPVELRQLHEGEFIEEGALALVRTGALYLDPATGDVWFHPWGGEPRIVGHNSAEGPGGDPNGDVAAWFEGNELVVYDTAAGRELSRTTQSQTVSDCDGLCAEHFQGNRFLLVSDERVVWAGGPSGDVTYSFDIRTLKTLRADEPNPGSAFVLGLPGPAEDAYDGLEVGRPSPSGNYVLGVEPGKEHLSVIVDTKTGAWWRIPNSGDPHVTWSYGDVVVVDLEDRNGGMIACDASRRTCERLPAEPPSLIPTN
ncbi:MAG TPA: hypothetical protein VMT88_14155 [Actinomycetes bacterium]|nr:hypothetical protein [Actinomycetes bacterium]